MKKTSLKPEIFQSENEIIRSPLRCHRCDCDLLTLDEIKNRPYLCWKASDVAYTFFHGLPTCMPCWRKLDSAEIMEGIEY